MMAVPLIIFPYLWRPVHASGVGHAVQVRVGGRVRADIRKERRVQRQLLGGDKIRVRHAARAVQRRGRVRQPPDTSLSFVVALRKDRQYMHWQKSRVTSILINLLKIEVTFCVLEPQL